VPEFLDPYNETVGGSALTSQLNAFTDENENVQVEVIAKRDTGPGGLLNLLTTAVDVAPAVLPDVIVLNKADMQIAANAGLVHPANEISVSWSDFYPFAVAGMDVENDDVYGLPFIADADHMAYRIDIADSPPISWTAVLTHEYTMIFPAGSSEALADDALLAAYIGSGGSVFDEEGQAILDRLYLEQVYAFFFDMIAQGLIDTDRALNLPDAEAAWSLYQEGLGSLSPVTWGLYWQNPIQGSRPVWMPNALEKPVAIVRNWSLAVVTADPNRQQAAFELIAWLVDPRHMSELSRSALLLPTRRHAVRIWGFLPEDQLFINTLLENGVPALPLEVDIPVRRALQFGLVAVLRQDVLTPEEAATYAMTNLRR
jgi:ABC-type glycerol-3-phosphate transport system substrate-binding protein